MHWDEFTRLHNDLPHVKYPNLKWKDYSEYERQQYVYFDHLLQGIQVDYGLLKTYTFTDNLNPKEYFVVGSLVKQDKNQDDEYDLYPCAIFDVFPDIT